MCSEERRQRGENEVNRTPKSHRWLLSGGRVYFVMTRQILLPSTEPSERKENEDGTMSTKESLNVAVLALTFSSKEFTGSSPSPLGDAARLATEGSGVGAFSLSRSADFEGLANFPVTGKCVEEFLHFRRGREFTGCKFRSTGIRPL